MEDGLACGPDAVFWLMMVALAVSSLTARQRLSEARKNFIIAVNFLRCCGRDDMRLLSASYFIAECGVRVSRLTVRQCAKTIHI